MAASSICRADSPADSAVAALSDEQVGNGLKQLGLMLAAELPADAQWVKVKPSGGAFGIFLERSDAFDAKGNAFLVKVNKDGSGEVWNPGMGRLKVLKPGKEDERQQGAEDDRSIPGTWSAADLSPDVSAAAAWLQKEKKKARKNVEKTASADPFARDQERSKYQQYERSALLWAAYLQRSGHAEEAMTLGRLVFQDLNVGERRKLLDQIFDSLADSEWQRCLGVFRQHPEWSRLEADLSRLVGTYVEGWKQRDAARVLLHYVSERSRAPQEPPLKLAQPLPAADQQVLTGWLKEMESGRPPSYGRWVLPATGDGEGEDDGNGRQRRPGGETGFPRNKGLAAVPLLAALLTDETLTLVQELTGRSGFDDDFDMGSGGPDPVEKLKTSYQRLSKPRSRADLAWAVLQQVLPNELSGDNEATAAERSASVLDWYAGVKSSAPEDLAISYLESDVSDPSLLILASKTNDPKKLARLENALLTSVRAYNLGGLAPYVEKRGALALPFLQKLRVKLEEEVASYGQSSGDPAKRIEREFKKLEAAASGETKTSSPEELLTAICNAKDSGEDFAELGDALQQLPAALAKLPDAERVTMVLKHVPECASSRVRIQLLWLLLDGQGGRRQGKPIGLQLDAGQRKAVILATRPHWQALLKLSEKEEEENDQPVAGLVVVMESLATGKPVREVYGQMEKLAMLGSRAAPIIRARVDVLLEGKEPPPWPDPESVPAEQTRQLMAELGKLPVEEINDRIEKLEPQFLLALGQAMTGGNEVPAVLRAYAGRINDVRLIKVAKTDAWTACKGKALTQDTCIEMARNISTSAAAALLTVTASRWSPVLGWQLRVEQGVLSTAGWQTSELQRVSGTMGPEMAKKAKRVSMAFLRGGDSSKQWAWIDDPGAGTAEETPAPANETEEAAGIREGFNKLHQEEKEGWLALSSLLAAGSMQQLQFFIISAPAADVAKLQNPTDPFSQ